MCNGNNCWGQRLSLAVPYGWGLSFLVCARCPSHSIETFLGRWHYSVCVSVIAVSENMFVLVCLCDWWVLLSAGFSLYWISFFLLARCTSFFCLFILHISFNSHTYLGVPLSNSFPYIYFFQSYFVMFLCLPQKKTVNSAGELKLNERRTMFSNFITVF